MRPQLSICIFLRSDEFASSVGELLDSARYTLTYSKSTEEFFAFVENHNPIDCLVLQMGPELSGLLDKLREQSLFLPAVIVAGEDLRAGPGPESRYSGENTPENRTFLYHVAEVYLSIYQVNQLAQSIDRAVAQFLNLADPVQPNDPATERDATAELNAQSWLHRQQRRLAEKLRERLGYLGVYYKRNPQNFLRNLPPAERQKLLEQLMSNYRQIVLNYFSQDNTLNSKIDELVNLAFFADIPVTQIVEIHMELMDEFSKQLKLEGRSEEVLLDYRLTLIDAIAHLCEMYRRSIPRES